MAKDDYEVGYAKPPKKNQYQTGQSGNPNGRPKGAKAMKTDLAEELAERVAVTENGKAVTLSKQRVMLKALTAKAMKGDTKAAATVISLVAQTIGLDPREEKTADLSTEDSAILAHWLSRNAPNSEPRNSSRTRNYNDHRTAVTADISAENGGDDDAWLN